MNYEDIKDKYFILTEGDERAIIRDTEAQAEKTRNRLTKHSEGKKIYIYRSIQRNG
jgi:hypothetical protein